MVYKLTSAVSGLEWFAGKASPNLISLQAHVLSQLQDSEVLIKRLVSKGVNPSRNSHVNHLYAKCTPKKLVKLLAKNRHIQELIHPDRLSKVYFDIDNKLRVLSLNKCKAVILERFLGASMHICGYQIPEKSSWHIVLSKYMATFADFPHLKSFTAAHESLRFDPAMYTKNQFMNWSFSWDNIEDMDMDRFHAYTDSVLKNLTWMIWDGDYDKLMDRINHFYKTDMDHVLHDLFSHIGIDPRVPCSKFNVQATIPDLLWGRIMDHYHQLESLQLGDTLMLCKCINVYFGKKLVDKRSKKRQVMINGTRYPNVDWTSLVKLFPL
ncbi:hypothetical protein GGF32_006855 [Allomyces javanicus]|nr:hypothetical protein GGF32_006855 [Allomyces javanicus]